MKKAWLSWSSGKDSAWCLEVLRQSSDVDVVGLVTTVNGVHNRVAMHAVRRELLALQADATGLPLLEVEIPASCSNREYEEAFGVALDRAASAGVTQLAFGDLFLEDVRLYRERLLEDTGLDPIFPLWGRDTMELANEMIDGGLKARLTCVDPRQADPSLAGTAYDARLLASLPRSVDPCGENGEFHTCVIDGPMFSHPIEVESGQIVEREGFWFADLVPGGLERGGVNA